MTGKLLDVAFGEDPEEAVLTDNSIARLMTAWMEQGGWDSFLSDEDPAKALDETRSLITRGSDPAAFGSNRQLGCATCEAAIGCMNERFVVCEICD